MENEKVVMIGCDKCEEHFYVDEEKASDPNLRCPFCGRKGTTYPTYSFFITPTLEEIAE